MITVIPTTWTALERALRERHPVRVLYHGHERVLSPHALGWKNGRAMLLGYQAGGWTSTGALDTDPHKRWRCLFVDEVAKVLAEPGKEPTTTSPPTRSTRSTMCSSPSLPTALDGRVRYYAASGEIRSLSW